MGNVSKVVYGDETLIDLTSDTVAADNLLAGATAHDAAGNAIVGTASIDDAIAEHNTSTTAHSDIREAIDGKLSQSDLQTGIDTALAQAKSSGNFDGGSCVVVTTNYFYDQSALNTYAKAGYTGSWKASDLNGVKAGDTVLFWLGNSSKGNGSCYVVAKCNSVSGVWVNATSFGLLDKGDTGASGATPVRGTDYWTEADKSEIVEDTKSAIDLSAYAKAADVEAVQTGLSTHTANADIHVTAEEKAAWNGKADGTHASQHEIGGYDEVNDLNIDKYNEKVGAVTDLVIDFDVAPVLSLTVSANTTFSSVIATIPSGYSRSGILLLQVDANVSITFPSNVLWTGSDMDIVTGTVYEIVFRKYPRDGKWIASCSASYIASSAKIVSAPTVE